MRYKFFALLVACAFVLNSAVAVPAFADTKSNKNNANQLLALLPASDAVATVDAKRFFGVALPQILSGNREMLDEVNAKIDEFKTNTGFDVRQFEQIAVGVAIKQTAAGKTDFDPLVLARGNFNASSLLTLAKFASGGKHREEKIGSRTVYIFSPKEVIENNRTAVKSSMIQKVLDQVLPRMTGEVAVTAYDTGTLAFGKVDRLKLMLTESKSKVDAGLLAMANRNPNAVVSFAANLPAGLSGFMNLGEDELGTNLGAIRQIYGTMDVAGDNTNVSLAAKLLSAERAKNLTEQLAGLKDMASMFLLSQKGEDKKVLGRMAKNARVANTGSEITIDLQVPQSDINILLGAK